MNVVEQKASGADIAPARHRPPGPWIMEQTWHDLLFAHWPIAPDTIKHKIPSGLTLDTFGGVAWIGILAFRLSGIRLRGLPPIAPVASFPEINVRTYVTLNGRPGVYFISLDADNRLAMAIARRWYRLNYTYSIIDFHPMGGAHQFSSRRAEPHLPDARFSSAYRPISNAHIYPCGSLEYWLTERYCYYAASKGNPNRLYRCDIDHQQWPLQKAEADIVDNSMALAHNIELPETPPFLHFARVMKARVWPLRRVAPIATPESEPVRYPASRQAEPITRRPLMREVE